MRVNTDAMLVAIFRIIHAFELHRDTFDKMRADLRLMTEEKQSIDKSKSPKEKSVASLQSSLEAMQSSASSLNEELGSDLLSQLSVEDQREVDYLSDQIKSLTQQNKEALTERIRVRMIESITALQKGRWNSVRVSMI